jgi:hypothetical protein
LELADNCDARCSSLDSENYSHNGESLFVTIHPLRGNSLEI